MAALTASPTREVLPNVDAAARSSIRAQIARLERELGLLAFELGNSGHVVPTLTCVRGDSPRLLDLAELETVRDRLVLRIADARDALKETLQARASARRRLESMLSDPRAHRFERIACSDVGECSCGAYEVRPRLGVLGMLFDWWCVKLSSGCPLSMPQRYYYRRPRERRSRNPKLEMTVSVVVVVALVVLLITFLFVYHDFPLRVSGP